MMPVAKSSRVVLECVKSKRISDADFVILNLGQATKKAPVSWHFVLQTSTPHANMDLDRFNRTSVHLCSRSSVPSGLDRNYASLAFANMITRLRR
ncbi:hypothetical protein TNCV_1987281 [Trichonephila clavipes]|nr:hypothetical protein TNCV_1987281 [Trichonephila clavipes]